MQFALLGDIQFDLITYFDGLDGRFGVDYAEHALIEGKPRLQRIGDKLDEWTLDLKFHQVFCDPETELANLRLAMMTYVPMPFVLATGEYKGNFVITDVLMTAQQTDPYGTVVSMSVSVTLRESVNPFDQQVRLDAPAVIVSGQPLHPVARNSVADLAQPNLAFSTLKNAVIAARSAISAANAASNIVSLSKGLSKNPLLAVSQLANVVPELGRIAIAADRMGVALGALPPTVGEAGSLWSMSGGVANEARNSMSILGDLSTLNFPGKLGSVTDSLGRINTAMSSAAPSLARLSAQVAVRGVV
jgi:phage protein U